jgi:hypothetical protein
MAEPTPRFGVDDRDEPGQGDLELVTGRCKQPYSLNRTALGRAGPKGSRIAPQIGAYNPALSRGGNDQLLGLISFSVGLWSKGCAG